jgi:hypothetical protein
MSFMFDKDVRLWDERSFLLEDTLVHQYSDIQQSRNSLSYCKWIQDLLHIVCFG